MLSSYTVIGESIFCKRDLLSRSVARQLLQELLEHNFQSLGRVVIQ